MWWICNNAKSYTFYFGNNWGFKRAGKPRPYSWKYYCFFKFITTKLYNEQLEIKNEKYVKLWQRNYYENIIRNEEIYIKVSEYIENNPLKWEEDKYFTK